MADESFVYLDHLIRRESLRYQRSDEEIYDNQSSSNLPSLRMIDLIKGSNISRLLRKPDFQRATWAWTPEDCVSLLESIVNEQVIPSIIMWSSPESGLDFILDGGHRVSVVMAWLNDDWGDKDRLDSAIDEDQIKLIKDAANKVRYLVDSQVGNVQRYKEAEETIERILEQGEENPKRIMGEETFKKGQFYRKLLKGGVSFHRLWVTGNYEKAEASFVKINRSGQQLLEWETKLIENRNSSFARAVMSISNVNSVNHYWPSRVPDGPDQEVLARKVPEIIQGIENLHRLLFIPTYRRPLASLKQPLVVAERQRRPFYLAELLTVVEGGKGVDVETEQLLQNGKDAAPSGIITSGHNLIKNAENTLAHLIGLSDDPRSLAIVPALYLYTDEGRYVRSFLYGMIYWLLSGNDDLILERKRIFSAHRAAFERILLERKDEIAGGITRKTGSGPEVTAQTASYYNDLLQLLINFDDRIGTEEFENSYAELSSKNSPSRSLASSSLRASRSRAFTEKQKSQTILRALLTNSIKCGICGGMLDPQSGLQHDHIVNWSEGGSTSPENQQLAHPFCNNNKTWIERIKNDKSLAQLPIMTATELSSQYHQLSFLEDLSFR